MNTRYLIIQHMLISNGRNPYIEQGLWFKMLTRLIMISNINLCHVEFTTPKQEVIIHVGESWPS